MISDYLWEYHSKFLIGCTGTVSKSYKVEKELVGIITGLIVWVRLLSDASLWECVTTHSLGNGVSSLI